MALTVRTDGTQGGTIAASWFNDFLNLFTGVMNDQTVTFKTNGGVLPLTLSTPGNATSGSTLLSLATTGTPAHSYSLNVDSSGNLTIYDNTNLRTGLQLNTDGSVELGAYNTSTSTMQLIKIFTGTTTPPTSAPDGSIWFKG